MSDETEIITQNIRRATRCPVCYWSAVDFGYVCENGHVVCRACAGRMTHANKLDSCPTCRATLATGSPMVVTLRLVYANLSVACVNRANGCRVVANVLAINRHETRCAYVRISVSDDRIGPA